MLEAGIVLFACRKRNRNGRVKVQTVDLLEHFGHLDQVLLTMLARQDSSMIGDMEEMENILPERWPPISAKHLDGESLEPNVSPLMERVGRFYFVAITNMNKSKERI